ncbi:MAG: hypothetical protein WDM70_01095 [Nitrosomonadales bacterium]
MKLTNIASLDPAITSTGRKGLEGASATDKAMWQEMQANWGRFAIEAQQAANTLEPLLKLNQLSIILLCRMRLPTTQGVNKTVLTTTRVGQNFFRRSVLSAYEYRCCITDCPNLSFGGKPHRTLAK